MLIEEWPRVRGCGRVSRKFHASHASTVVLPGPLQAFIASRWLCGNESSASSCHASGSTPNNSRTMELGLSRQRVMWEARAVKLTAGGSDSYDDAACALDAACTELQTTPQR